MRIQLSEHFTYKKLLKFVMPSIVMMVFVSIYGTVDGLFVSNFVGESAIAAINLSLPLIIILGAIGFMIGTGGSALVSKTLGEGDKEKANAYFSMLVYVTFAVGVAIAVAGQFAIPPIARILCPEGEEKTYEYCVLYGRILLAAQPFYILQNIFQSFFVTAEKPRLGLIVTVASGITNIVLDAVFVAGFKWGLAGAAAATTASQVLGGVFPIIYFLCKNNSLLRLTKTKFYGKALLKSVTNGSSEFFSNVSTAIIIMLYNYQIQKFVPGSSGIAAYGAIGYVIMIVFSVFFGYAVGSAPLIGYNYGAGNKEELKNLYKKSIIITTVAGFGITVLVEALSYPIVLVFGFEKEVFDMALRCLQIYAVSFTVAGYSVFGSSLFTALNNGLISGIISFARTLVFQIIAIMVVPLWLGLDGVWSAMCFAEIPSLIITVTCILYFRKKYGYA